MSETEMKNGLDEQAGQKTYNDFAGNIFSEAQVESVAEKCHEANREYCAAEGLPIQEPWAKISPEIMACLCAGVIDLIKSPVITPEVSHNNWLSWRSEQGWIYGETKDEAAKTHPNLVPWADLPPAEQRKDTVFVDTAKAELIDIILAAPDEVPASLDELEGADVEVVETGEVPCRGIEGLTTQDIEEACTAAYEADRIYRVSIGDNSRPPWAQARDSEMREAVMERVAHLLDTPDDIKPDDNAVVSMALHRLKILADTSLPEEEPDKDGGGKPAGLAVDTVKQSVQSSRG